MKINLWILIYFFVSAAFGQGGSAATSEPSLTPSSFSAQSIRSQNDCGAVTFFGDLKGNGQKEKVVLTNATLHGDCCFKSFIIFDKDVEVYKIEQQLTDLDDIFDKSETLKVEPLRKGRMSQIIFSVHHSDAAGSGVKVIEWGGGKYTETLSEDHAGRFEINDLENDGNKEIVFYGSNYDDSLPDIYEFDSAQKKYVVSNKKHLGFYRKLEDKYEKNLKFPEKGHDCCIRTDNLGKLINAASLIGDQEKVKDATRRLSEVYVEYGKAYYLENDFKQALEFYAYAIEKDGNNWTAFGLRGYSFLRIHEVKKAIDSLEHSMVLNPNYASGHYNLALAYWANGQKTDSIDQLKKLYGSDPSYKAHVEDDTQFKEILKTREYQTMIKGLSIRP